MAPFADAEGRHPLVNPITREAYPYLLEAMPHRLWEDAYRWRRTVARASRRAGTCARITKRCARVAVAILAALTEDAMKRHGRRDAIGLRLAGLMLLAVGFPASAWPADPGGAVRTLPSQVREDVNDIARQLLKVRDDDVELACPKAVENARWGVETMLEVGERNLQDGYLGRADYDRMAAPLKTRLETLTLADCENATGARREFYRCMSSDYNHVMACATAHE